MMHEEIKQPSSTLLLALIRHSYRNLSVQFLCHVIRDYVTWSGIEAKHLSSVLAARCRFAIPPMFSVIAG